jgi:broad specificity phosphatase PhoE
MHSTTEDNEAGIATGWLPGRLSAQGRQLAADLADCRRRAAADAVFISDLNRALETVELTLGRDPVVPVLDDWRLRECDFGDLNGADAALVHAERLRFLDEPYPAGESWRQAIDRVGRFIADLSTRSSPRRDVAAAATQVSLNRTRGDSRARDRSGTPYGVGSRPRPKGRRLDTPGPQHGPYREQLGQRPVVERLHVTTKRTFDPR